MRLERDTLALAAFVSRPQAEAQIGANRIEIYNVIRSLSMQNVGWAEPGEAQYPYLAINFVGFRCRLTQPTELSTMLDTAAIPTTNTMTLQNNNSQGKNLRKRMWLLSFLDASYERAIWWHDAANIVLVLSLLIGVIATYVSLRTAGTQAEYLKRDLASTNERAAALELSAEELRKKNLAFEQAISPRILEQRLTGQKLKPFSDMEVIVDSLSEAEPRRTADQIRYMLIAEAGWKKFSGTVSYPHFFDGVVIHTGEGPEAKRAGDAAKVLVEQLTANGIEASKGVVLPELGTKGILVYVGLKPVPPVLLHKAADSGGKELWGSRLIE